jgi:alpha-ketoglutarate-dependent taurine dioxygenase
MRVSLACTEESDPMTISYKPIQPRIGVEVHGVDAASGLSAAEAEQVLCLLDRYGVVVFPRLEPDDPQQIALARALGTIVPAYRGDPAHAPEYPELFTVSLDPEHSGAAEYLKGSLFWHIDGTTKDVPPMASMLSARELPAEGAGTEFCNTYAAYEDLPADEQAQLEGLRVVHSLEQSQRRVEPNPSDEQLAAWRRQLPRELPLVWTHRSGRKSLVLGTTASHVVGMEADESRALIDRLEEWATRPEFVYRHAWSPGDLVIWDNRGTMHRASAYELTARRVMRRVELAGEEPITSKS